MSTAPKPVGVVLAGGDGRRIGGDKAIVELEGRPLVHYPVEALHEVCDEVAVVAKRDTVLPSLGGVADVWIEPDEPRHPLCGIVHALQLAGGRAVIVIAVDLPLVDGATLRLLIERAAGGAPAVVPRAHGRLQPFCALYTARALPGLESFDHDEPATDVVERLGAEIVEPEDGTAFFNVNRPEDLLHASVLLRR